MPEITRRRLLVSLPAITAVVAQSVEAAVAAQTSSPPIRVRSLNHFGIAVSDTKRSVEFYQGLFGLAVQARDGATTILRIGTGPQFLSISPVNGNAAPSITHFCLGVEDFSVDRIMATLAAHGVPKADALGPMRATVVEHDGRVDLLFGDPDGIVCQLQDPSYCGGSGPLGNRCSAAEVAPKQRLIALRDLNHLTIFSGNSERSNKFYRNLFGFSIRSYQGPTAPTLAVGPSVQFLMLAGSATTTRPNINHACWTLDGFKPDAILKVLGGYGLRPREGVPGPTGPLRHYVTMRMENRGGAPGGTPELYFTDPDGLLMQLQDATYCGGGGVLGNECSKV